MLHFVVATCIATVYYCISLVLPFVIENAVVSGLAYGIVAYFGMNYVIVPLSAIRSFPGSKRTSVLIVEIIGHAVLVGLPVALLARRSARLQSQIRT